MVLLWNDYVAQGQKAGEAAHASALFDCQTAVVVAFHILKKVRGQNDEFSDRDFFHPEPWIQPGRVIPSEELAAIFKDFKGTCLLPRGGADSKTTAKDLIQDFQDKDPELKAFIQSYRELAIGVLRAERVA